MTDLPLTGGCMCGAVRFEVTEAPVTASYCHCTRCQRRSGTAASVQARVAPGSVRVIAGDELVGSWKPDDGFAKEYCSTCGSALWARNPETGDVMSVRLGAFDADPGVRPTFRQFVAYAVPWEPIPEDGTERFPERRPPDA